MSGRRRRGAGDPARDRSAIRLLHVSQPVDAGVPTVVAQLVRDQLEHGWEVAVAAPPGGQLAAELATDPVTIRGWAATRDPGRELIAEIAALRRIIGETKPDLVHLHSAKAGLAGRLILRGGLPTVFQPHAWSFEAVRGVVATAARTWERIAARWTDLTICVSEGERISGQHAGIRGRTIVLPNGVDLRSLDPADDAARQRARAALGLAQGPLVVSVGRLAHQKGHDVLIRAVPALQARVPDVRVVIIGDGPEAAALRALAGPNVTLVGHRDDVRLWLAASDVVALPSRWEAGSLVLLEAMAVGRSVVATSVAGVQALAAGAGAVVPAEDPGALAEALAHRLRDPEVAAAEGARGRAFVELAHDQRHTTRSIREAYSSLIEVRASRSGNRRH